MENYGSCVEGGVANAYLEKLENPETISELVGIFVDSWLLKNSVVKHCTVLLSRVRPLQNQVSIECS